MLTEEVRDGNSDGSADQSRLTANLFAFSANSNGFFFVAQMRLSRKEDKALNLYSRVGQKGRT